MDTAIIVAVVALFQGVTVAIINGILSRNRKEDEARERKRDNEQRAREERDAAVYDLTFALANGVEVLLHQAHGERLNGNVEDALNQITRAKSECNHLFNKTVAKL